MPSGKNWINFLYINIAFAIYIASVFYYSQLAEIKANWPLYRCNPMYMPLADNVEQNFVYTEPKINKRRILTQFISILTFVLTLLGKIFQKKYIIQTILLYQILTQN